MPNTAITNFPAIYNAQDQAIVYALLDEAERYSNPYDGDWTSSWLLSDIYDDTWIINIDGVTEFIDGRYLRAEYFHWNIGLRDGTNLADPVYKQFKNVLQKLGFLVKEYGFYSTWKSHLGFCNFLSTLARWLLLHRDIYDPLNALLTRLDQYSINDYIYDYSKGGVIELLKINQQIITLLYEHALNRLPSVTVLDNVYSVPDEDRLAVKEWLSKNKLITKHKHWVTNFIKHLSSSINVGIDPEQLRHDPKFRAFLCQFEYDTVPNLLPGKFWNEFPSHKTPLRKEVVSSLCSFESLGRVVDNWRQLFTLKLHLPEALPDESIFSRKSSWQYARENSSPSEHTPWIPLKAALTYTNEALRWVHVYGNDLISLYLTVIRHMNKTVRPNNKHQYAYKEWRKRIEDYAKTLIIPDSLSQLNIHGFFCTDQKKRSVYENIRLNPSICDAIEILIGAIATLIGALKPFRESELRNISRNCIELVKGDGYWLNQPIRKKKIGDVGDNGNRPIPYIVARAIELMQKLSDDTKEIQGIKSDFLRSKLFVFPPPKAPFKAANLMSQRSLSVSLDAFCDFVNFPTDEYGRRWYIRTHESRKSFLIIFFWCFRYSSLDAARWMAMHGDVAHLYAYIQANFPGDELPGIEAEYATRQLWSFEEYQCAGETDNLEDLYNAVCRHFNVTSLNLLSENDVHDWIELAFNRGIFKIEPYTVKTTAESEGIRIAFRIQAEALQ